MWVFARALLYVTAHFIANQRGEFGVRRTCDVLGKSSVILLKEIALLFHNSTAWMITPSGVREGGRGKRQLDESQVFCYAGEQTSPTNSGLQQITSSPVSVQLK